jgi:hypothetical protein
MRSSQTVNVTAERARAGDLIDVVAASERELLERLDGFKVAGQRPGRSTPRACASSGTKCRST